MKIVETVDVLCVGDIVDSPVWHAACDHVKTAIAAVDWPHGSGKFSIHPERRGNGVGPIKIPCIEHLKLLGWRDEQLPAALAGVKMGNLDALLETPEGPIGFEWETGNISSSHRAINKILHALIRGGLLGGILVVPSRLLYGFLTDRVGNINELRPYIPVWEHVRIERGAFRIEVVEYDETSVDAPKIPKGTDGRARR